MSNLKLTKYDFRTDEEYEQYKQRMKELEEMELKHNVQMISRSRIQGKSPCKLFYQFKKGIPLSVFLRVYPFNELVDCGSGFELPELNELERLYSTFEGDKQLYIDSFHRLQQVINNILSNKVPGSYGKGFQPWKEQVAANQEIKDIMRNPEPSQREINRIENDNYMQTKIPSPPPPQEQSQVSQQQQQPESLFGKVKNFFGVDGGRKTSKKIMRRQKRSNSRRSNSKSKKSRPHSKKSRSKKII